MLWPGAKLPPGPHASLFETPQFLAIMPEIMDDGQKRHFGQRLDHPQANVTTNARLGSELGITPFGLVAKSGPGASNLDVLHL
jgi:hypothetical protein